MTTAIRSGLNRSQSGVANRQEFPAMTLRNILRDDVVHFIELRWPDLVDGINQPASIEGFFATIRRACPGAESTDGYIQLTEHIGKLWEFLESNRYKGDPRQIAYALAGVPEMAWRSSFTLYAETPHAAHITLSAFVDRIRRNSPKCLSALLSDGPTKENRKLLRSCCPRIPPIGYKTREDAESLGSWEALRSTNKKTINMESFPVASRLSEFGRLPTGMMGSIRLYSGISNFDNLKESSSVHLEPAMKIIPNLRDQRLDCTSDASCRACCRTREAGSACHRSGRPPGSEPFRCDIR